MQLFFKFRDVIIMNQSKRNKDATFQNTVLRLSCKKVSNILMPYLPLTLLFFS